MKQSNKNRRATAIVAVLIVVMIADLIVVGMLLNGARGQDLSVRRYETEQAFYAAEAGVNMALRELTLNVDEDGDGEIGTISDDDNDANDPTVGTGFLVVTSAEDNQRTILTSTGRCGQSRREVKVIIE